MYRVAIWGIGNVYYEYRNLLQCYELLGEIGIQVYISKKIELLSFDGKPIVSSEVFFNKYYDDVDCIVVASASYDDILHEAELKIGGCAIRFFALTY